jgi:predicted signal transduction protein with EAL and GGDEF domain
MVFRLGGDEFTVILTNVHYDTDPAVVAEKLIRAFNDPFEVDDNTLHLGISIGIAIYPRDGSEAANLIRSADTALFEAKRERSSYRFFTEAMQQRALEKLRLVGRLHESIERGDFKVNFQPIVNQRSQVVACEALLAWSHPEMGQVPPHQFIPLAEETGLIVALGGVGLRASCNLLRRLEKGGHPSTKISVNLSLNQLRDPELIAEIDKEINESRSDPAKLEFEITESGLMRDNQALKQIEELRARGFRFSIDDFGTGYSSLARLRSFPIDTLKIDRSFVAGTPDNRKDCDLVRSVITLAHNFGLNVCAEGVETRQQFEFLCDAGCDLLQGYFFSLPVPADGFIAYLESC